MFPCRRLTAAGFLLVVASFLAARPAVPPPPPVTQRPAEPPRLDLMGDPLPPGALSRAGTLRFRHGGEIGQIVFAPDGRTVYTACPQGNSTPAEKFARAWSVPDGRVLRRFGRGAGVSAVAVSPDGKLVATGEDEHVVRIWDAASGQEMRRLKAALPERNRDQDQVWAVVTGLRFGADGKTIVVMFPHPHAAAAVVWDVASGAEVLSWTDEHFPVALSADGKRMAAVGNGVQIVDMTTGVEVQTVLSSNDPKAAGESLFPALSANGGLVAVATGDKVVRLLEVAGGKERWRETLKGNVAAMAFSRDGAAFAVASAPDEGAGEVLILDAGTGKEVTRLVGAESDVRALSFSPDGKTLATGGGGHTLQLWDVATGKPLPSPAGHPGPMTTIAVSTDGRLLATCSDRDLLIRLWDTATGREVRRLEGQRPGVDEVTISPDGKLLASAVRGGPVFLWEVATGRLVHKLGEDAELGPYLRFADDGKTLAIGGEGNTVGLWDCTTGKQVREMPTPPNGLASMLTFHDGRLLGYEKPVASNDDGLTPLCLWDVTANRLVRQFSGHTYGASSVILSNDGRMLASRGIDKTIRVWDVATGGERCRLEEPGRIDHIAGWTGTQFLAFSPDRRCLITAATDDPFARRWDLWTGKEMPPLAGHLSWVGAVEFSADGRVLVTGSQDTTSLAWDWTAMRPRTPDAVVRGETELAHFWDDLRESDAAKAYQAILALTQCGDLGVKAIAARLRPAPAADAARIKLWIEALDHPRFAERERATTALVGVGGPAEDALRAARHRTRSAEVRQRIDRILDAGWDPAGWPDRLQELRAVEVLETIGTPLAREHLRVLAGGAAGATATREARAALRRLGETGSSPAPR